ncbi:hypothetical protein EKA98_06210 [Streptococcus pseudopneumoniae]|uniref:Chlorohydrolase n=1 Tax=Streptococcus pseudopneumoniae TaxID=257758 RepID=A0ABX9P737_9STRE|nr:hypothetical protein [Streptococcus pseudopneumoniae]NIB88721.1 hypothetical protein [Streptococcus pseudopneumoniae]RJY07390.1 hypothetical protein D6867_10150 [Streptococcus pseudopneumoniae]TMR78449.1 hypothetical protein E3V35_09510 [Streptococcus pseudopneumoniae]TMR78811.1 hypothetical protein E3V52_04790 [Streptococcus pseudopneumoniae]
MLDNNAKKLLLKACLLALSSIFSCHTPLLTILYSMKIKKQTRKLAAGCSKPCFEVVDETDEVSNHTYGKATLTWFEEIFEEY